MIGLGSSSQLGIGIAISLENRFSGTSGRVIQDMRRLRNENYQMNRQALSDYRNRAAGIAVGAAGAVYGMSRLVKQGAAFSQQLQKVTILADGKLGRGQLKKMTMQLSNMFGEDPQKVMEAYFENVKAGVTGGIDNITKYQMAVARATDETLEGQQGVAKGLLNITNAMEIPYSRFADVANAVTVAANQSQASVSSLNESMKYTANTAHRAGMGLNETLAALAMLSQMGIEGSSSGTALSNLIRYSAKAGGPFATKRSLAGLKMLGIDPRQLSDDKGNLKGVLDIMDMISAKLKGMGTTQQLGILEAIFGVRGEKAGINLMGKDGRGISGRGFLAQIEAGVKQDIAMKQSKEMMDTLQGDLMRIRVKWAQFAIAFTDAIEPLLRKGLPILNKLLTGLIKFSNTGFGKVAFSLIAVAVPLVGALFAFRVAIATATLALTGSRGVGFGTAMKGVLGSQAPPKPNYGFIQNPSRGGGPGGVGMYGGYAISRGGPPMYNSISGLGYHAPGQMGRLTRNVNGRWTVKAGTTYRGYRGGQLVPGWALPQNPYNVPFTSPVPKRSGLATWGAPLMANTAGRQGVDMSQFQQRLPPTGFYGRAGAFMGNTLGKLGSVAGNTLNIVAAVGILTGLLGTVYDFFTKKEDPVDEFTRKGYTIDDMINAPAVYNKDRIDQLLKLGLAEQAKKELNNNITINLNGQKVGDFTTTNSIDQDSEEVLNQIDQDI